MGEQGWLIEGKIGLTPIWLREAACASGCINFTTDASIAIRFSRESDALSVLRILQKSGVLKEHWTVTGHEWVDAPIAKQDAT